MKSGRKRRERSGSVLILAAVLMVVMFAFLGFALDLGWICTNKAQLQNAADAAAFAAALSLSSEGEAEAVQTAIEYAALNVSSAATNVTDASCVTLGEWDAETRTFTPNAAQPNAVKVICRRTAAAGNAVPLFFARVLGHDFADVQAAAVVAGPVYDYLGDGSVYVTSTKDLSNVVLAFEDGVHQKFDDLSGYTSTFSGTGENEGKAIVTVWVKSGPNNSGDGPGYGERFGDPGNSEPMHGVPASGPIPHITVTYDATGAEFETTGSASPYRLVQ